MTASIDALVREHRKVLGSLDQLLANLNQPEPHLTDDREQCRLWVHEVRGHETRENDLIQDAFRMTSG